MVVKRWYYPGLTDEEHNATISLCTKGVDGEEGFITRISKQELEKHRGYHRCCDLWIDPASIHVWRPRKDGRDKLFAV